MPAACPQLRARSQDEDEGERSDDSEEEMRGPTSYGELMELLQTGQTQ